MSRFPLMICSLFLLAACQQEDFPSRAVLSVPAAAATPAVTRVVDSIRPLEEEIRRFTSSWPPESALAGGAPSREDLVRQWVGALEAGDTATLARLHITPGEFIGLYYPNSIYREPPYRQSPSLVWFRMARSSSQGVTRVMRRHGGVPLGYRSLRCEAAPSTLGLLRIWSGCVVLRRGESGPGAQRLFGPIIAHGGQYKFLTYASEY